LVATNIATFRVEGQLPKEKAGSATVLQIKWACLLSLAMVFTEDTVAQLDEALLPFLFPSCRIVT
jgi:hypothetical protein